MNREQELIERLSLLTIQELRELQRQFEIVFSPTFEAVRSDLETEKSSIINALIEDWEHVAEALA